MDRASVFGTERRGFESLRGYMKNLFKQVYGSIVQWTERQFPKLKIQVRLLVGLLKKKKTAELVVTEESFEYRTNDYFNEEDEFELLYFGMVRTCKLKRDRDKDGNPHGRYYAPTVCYVYAETLESRKKPK